MVAWLSEVPSLLVVCSALSFFRIFDMVLPVDEVLEEKEELTR